MSPLHKKLLGLWKSDQRKTLQTFHRYHRLPPGVKKRRVASLFGRLELRYTRQYLYTQLGDFETRERYEVVAEDGQSIVLRIYAEDLKKRLDRLLRESCPPDFFEPRIEKITFRKEPAGEYYWIGCGHFCEWFRRKG